MAACGEDAALLRRDCGDNRHFKAPHFGKYPQLHTLFNEATKLAGGGGGTKASTDPSVAEELLAKTEVLGDQAGLRPS
jgi:hypothetical protein